MQKVFLIVFTLSLNTVWSTEIFQTEGEFSDPSMVEVEDVSVSYNGAIPEWESLNSTVGTYAQGGCSDCPTEISTYSALSMANWGATAQYCRDLVEGGNSDWRMPTLDELTYLAIVGPSSGTLANEDSWTITRLELLPSVSYERNWYTFNLLTGERKVRNGTSSGVKALCIR